MSSWERRLVSCPSSGGLDLQMVTVQAKGFGGGWSLRTLVTCQAVWNCFKPRPKVDSQNNLKAGG